MKLIHFQNYHFLSGVRTSQDWLITFYWNKTTLSPSVPELARILFLSQQALFCRSLLRVAENILNLLAFVFIFLSIKYFPISSKALLASSNVSMHHGHAVRAKVMILMDFLTYVSF